MAILEVFSQFYAKAEDRYFSALDWLDAKGIPVYAYSNALEAHGIPSFPFTVCLVIVLLAALAWFFLLPQGGSTTLLLGLTDQSRNALSDVSIKVMDADARTVFEDSLSNGDAIEIKSATGKAFTVSASKDGYDGASGTVNVRSENENIALVLNKQLHPISAKVRFVDAQSGLPVGNASVSMAWEDVVRTGKTDANGFFSVDGLPENEDILLSVSSDNYEPVQTTVRLLQGQVRSVPLTPKDSATFGNAKLIVKVFDADTDAPVNDANVTVFNPQSKASYFEGYTSDGQYIADLPKGTVFAVSVSKQGFVRFVSPSATIRDDVAQQEVQLQRGGNALKVTVVAAGGSVPLPNAIVTVYRFDGTQFDQQQAPFSGTVNFTGLSPDENYIVTAYLAGYLPFATGVSTLEASDLTIELSAQNETNMAKLGVYVTDAAGLAGNNASVEFEQVIEGVRLPTGIPTATTEYDGYVSAQLPVGYNILVSVSRGLEAGDANVLIQQGENNVAVRLKLVDSARLLRILGIDGNPLSDGFVRIESASGDVLFDDNVNADGTVLFDAKTAQVIDITVTTPDGNVFTDSENVKNKKEILIRLRPNNASALSPPITFIGLENSDGTPADGLTPGAEYWARFEVSWVEGEYRGGVHVRVGNDAEPFAESDDAGITGFDAGGYASFALSRSFSPTPLPGNEALDQSNRGEAGQYSKWLEIYFDNPKGVQQFRVKIKAKEAISKQSVFLHYRSWAVIGSSYQRTPVDAELGTDAFSQSKTGLYATTRNETLKVFSGSTDCVQETCVTFRIVSEDGATFEKTEFTTAGRGRVYALEAVIRSQEAVGALLSATTPKQQPKLFFTGTEVESFTQFIDNNSLQTAIEINDLSVLENVERRARIYFKPVQFGPATIHVEFLAEGTVVKEDFFFTVSDERALFVAVDPSVVEIGKPFRVLVIDDANRPVQNATVHIRDRLNAIVATQVGKAGTVGQNGAYSFSGAIGGGEFSAEVSAPGFFPRTVPFSVSATDALSLPEEITLKMLQGIPNAQTSVDLLNKSGTLVRDIGVDVLPESDWPNSLAANAGTVASLQPGKSAKLDVSAVYTGDRNAREQGTAIIRVSGYVVGKYPATAETRLTVSYNQPIDANCLVFAPDRLTVYLAANAPYPGIDQSLTPSQYYADYSKYNASYPTYFGNQSPYNQQYYNSQMDPSYQDQYNQSGAANNNSLYDSRYGQYGTPQYSQYSPQYGGYNSQYAGQGSLGTNPYSSFGYNAPSSYYSPYSNQYNAYDNQQKEIEVQVTNNCDVPLNLTGSAAVRGTNTPDQFLQVTVPPLSVDPNTTTTTTITIRNLREQIVSNQETHNYDITYSYNPQLAKIPLSVVMWDSRFALAMPQNIVMYLSQGQKGEPVVASEPVFVRNIGLSDIQNFNLTLSGDTFSNGVDVRLVPFGAVPVFGRNQVLYPPKLVVAELRGGTEKGRLVRQQLVATGTIDGREIELGRANVWINVSAYECLRVSPAESLDFISSEAQFGVIDKKIRIRNTCEEAVHVVDVQPNRLGANEVTLVPIATDTLPPDGEAEFFVRLVKRQDYKSQNLNFSVSGFTTVSRKFIASNRLKAVVELGRTSVSTGAATEPYTMSVCNEDGTISTQTTKVSFPKIAQTAACDKAYCDAEQAAEYIVKKLTQKVAQAQQAVGYGNGEALNFSDNCIVTPAKPTCSFGELDPKIPETFDLFMQNDRLTPDLMQKMLLDKAGADLRNYTVNYCAGGRCDAEVIAATGYPNLILMSDNLVGCARYRVSIDGAAFVNQTQIRNTGFTLAVNVASREETGECTNRIENVSNFLPLDKGIVAAGGLGSYMGTAQAQTKYLPLAEAFAKEFYGSAENRVFENAPGNKIQVETGEVPGGIVKVSLGSFGSSTDPKTVLATVNRTIEGVDLTQGATGTQAAVVKEAASAIASLKSRTIAQGKGCISANHDYFVLGAASKLGEIVLTGADKVAVQPQSEQCIDVTVSSELKESVHITSNADDVRAGSNAFTQIILKNKIDGLPLTPLDTVSLDQDPATKKYQKAVSVCVTGSEWFQFAQGANKLTVTAQSVTDALRRSPEKEIGYKTCGVHPFDLVNALNAKSPGTYYATVGWKGAPDTVKLCDVVKSMADAGQLSSDATFFCNGVATSKQKNVTDAVKKQRLDAIYWKYLPACLTASAACNSVLTMGWGVILGAPVMDCGLPALWAIAPDVGGLKQARAFLEDKLSSTLGRVTGRVADLMSKTLPGSDNDALRADLINGAVGSEAARTLLSTGALKFLSFANYTKLPISSASRQIATDIAQQVTDAALVSEAKAAAVPGAAALRAKFADTIIKELEPQIQAAMEAEAKKSGGLISTAFGRKGIALADEKAISAATTTALAKAQPEIQKELFDFARTNPTLMLSKIKLPSQNDLIATATSKFNDNLSTVNPSTTQVGARDAMADKILRDLRSYGLKDGDAITSNVSYKPPTGAAHPATNIEELVKGTLQNTKNLEPIKLTDPVVGKGVKISAKYSWKIGDPVTLYDDILHQIADNPANAAVWERSLAKVGAKEAEDFVKPLLEGKTSSVSNFTKFRKFLTSAAKGLACGYIANLAGTFAYSSATKTPPAIEGPKTTLTGPAAQDTTGGVKTNTNGGVDSETTLKQGVTYRISVKLDAANAKTIQIAAVSQSSPIAANTAKEAWLNSDCTGAYAFRDLSGVVDEAALASVKLEEQKKEAAKKQLQAETLAKDKRQRTDSQKQFDAYSAVHKDPQGIPANH